MSDLIRVCKNPYLIRPDMREWKAISYERKMTIGMLVEEFSNDLLRLGFTDLVITRNGCLARLDETPKAGDIISISPRHGDPFSIAAWIMGFTIFWGNVAMTIALGVVIGAVEIVGVGLLINTLTPHPTAKGTRNDSPTYGFQAINSTVEGNPIPEVCGYVQTVPQIMGSYREVGSDYNMWVYMLLGLCHGQTNNPVTANDVYVGEELLTTFNDHYFGTTQGLINPDGSDQYALALKFASTKHDRSFDRILQYGSPGQVAQPAKGTITFNYRPIVDQDMFTIGPDTWIFKNDRTQPREIALDPGESEVTITNIVNAINADSVEVTAEANGYAITVTAKYAGGYGNTIAFSQATGGSLSCDGPDHLGGTQQGFDASEGSNIFQIATLNKCEHVGLIFTFPYGKFQINENGDFFGKEVLMAIGYRAVWDTGLIMWSTVELTGVSTQTVRTAIQVDFAGGQRTYYNIYLQRQTPDDSGDETKQRSTCYLSSFTEIIDIGQYYPGIQCAIIGLKATDKISEQVPVIKVNQNRTAVATLGWDGVNWGSLDPTVPAYAAYQGLTDPYNGRSIAPSKIVKTALDEWAAYTEERVNGNRRAQCNVIFDEPGSFGDNCLKIIEDVGRAKILQSGNMWTFVIDKPKTACCTFSAGNIIQGSFQWQGYEDPEKVDAVEITFWDKDNNFTKTPALAKASWYNAMDWEPRIAKIELRACNNLDQATREAILRMQKTEMITRHGEMDVLIRAAGIERWDVFNLIPPRWGGMLARDHAGQVIIYLDKEIYMPSATFEGVSKLYLVDPDGIAREYGIVGPFDVLTQTVEIDGGYTGNRFDVWGIGRPTVDKLLYQVATKKFVPQTEDRQAYVHLEFFEYVDAVFYHPDYGNGQVPI